MPKRSGDPGPLLDRIDIHPPVASGDPRSPAGDYDVPRVEYDKLTGDPVVRTALITSSTPGLRRHGLCWDPYGAARSEPSAVVRGRVENARVIQRERLGVGGDTQYAVRSRPRIITNADMGPAEWA